jgi:hypothetical protein
VVGKPEDVAARRPFTLIDVAGARLTHLDIGARSGAGAAPLLQARDSGDVLVAGARVRGDLQPPVLEVQGNARHGGVSLCRHVVSDCAPAQRQP